MVGITMCILYICECKLYAIMHAHVSGYALVLKIIFFLPFLRRSWGVRWVSKIIENVTFEYAFF